MIGRISRVLRGEQSLPTTYWLYGALGWLAGFVALSQQRVVDPEFWTIAAIWFVYVFAHA